MANNSIPSKPKALAQVWFTETETAQRLNMSRKWLQKERLLGGGLRFAKFGSAVRYLLADIEAYERSSLRNSTSDVGPEQL